MSHWRTAQRWFPALCRSWLAVLSFAPMAVLSIVPMASGCGSDSKNGSPDAGADASAPGDAGTPGDAGADGGLAIADHCNPLGFDACLMPWPSAAYLREAETATGVALDLPAEAMPVNGSQIAVDPAPFNRFDGFSPTGPIVAVFPGGVSPEGLPPHTDPAASLRDDSPVMVVDMATGARLLVFAEIDANVIYPEDRALIIRPLERMKPGARYAVAIRKSVKALGGGELPASPGFRALLEGRALEHPRMARLAPRYEAIFSALEAQGVSRDDLVLAWDFVTASDEFLTGDLLAMRTQALADMGENGTNLSFEAAEIDSDPAQVYRALNGVYEAPSFLSDGERPASVLVRGDDGLPKLNGRMEARFSAIIPACVTQAPLPRPVVIFGHGLFGNAAGSLADTRLRQVAQESCVVFVGGDFIGLTNRQLPVAADLATNLNLADRITEKLPQSIINFIALAQIVRGPFGNDPLFQHEGESVLDPDEVYYFGASLGGIMGNVFMAYDPAVPRGVLGVPGGAWSLLLERSLAWTALQAVAMLAYADPLDYQILVALLGMRFEPYDAITTAGRVLADPLPGTPAKQILMYQGVGDSLVNNLSTEMVARTMGIDLVGPSLYVPYGLEERTGTLASGFSIYDEHPEPLPPGTNQPPSEDNGTHGGVNGRPAVLRQIARFLLTGEVVNECQLPGEDQPAPCDCATGACD